MRQNQGNGSHWYAVLHKGVEWYGKKEEEEKKRVRWERNEGDVGQGRREEKE